MLSKFCWHTGRLLVETLALITKRNHGKTSQQLKTIGWREWVALPELGIPQLKAKIDSGARTSALHAFMAEPFTRDDGTEWVRFGIHPVQRSTKKEMDCELPITDRRGVTDAGGHREERIVVATLVSLGEANFPIELTLTSRPTMQFRMLLGRTAMRGRFTIDPAKSYLCSKRKPVKD